MRYTTKEMSAEDMEYVQKKAEEYDFLDEEDLIVDLFACLQEGVEEVLMTRQDVLYAYRTIGDWQKVYKFVSTLFFNYLYRCYDAEDALDRLLSYMRFLDPREEAGKDRQTKSLLDQIEKFLEVVQMCGGDQSPEDKEGDAGDAAAFMRKESGSGEDEESGGKVMALLAGADPSPGTFAGQYPERLDNMRRFISNMSREDWKKTHIVDNFDSLVEEAFKTKEREDSRSPEDNIDISKTKGIQDIGKVTKSEMAKHDKMEDLVLSVHRQEADKIQDQMDIQKKQLLYFLIDCSYSMSSGSVMVKTDRHESTAANGTVASCVAYAFVRKIKHENGIFYLRFFDGIPHDLIHADRPEDFRHVSRMLGIADYNGGGTNIMMAIKQAYADIEAAEHSTALEKATVCLITDGQDDCGALGKKEWKDRIEKYGLHVVMIGQYYNDSLRDNATTFREVKSLRQKDMRGMVNDFMEIKK